MVPKSGGDCWKPPDLSVRHDEWKTLAPLVSEAANLCSGCRRTFEHSLEEAAAQRLKVRTIPTGVGCQLFQCHPNPRWGSAILCGDKQCPKLLLLSRALRQLGRPVAWSRIPHACAKLQWPAGDGQWPRNGLPSRECTDVLASPRQLPPAPSLPALRPPGGASRAIAPRRGKAP